MLSREKKPGSRTAVRAVCSSSRTGEDWSFADPLHPPRGATLDLVPGLAAGDHTRPVPCLVFLSASPSGRCSSVSLQTATGCCKNLTPTVVLVKTRRRFRARVPCHLTMFHAPGFYDPGCGAHQASRQESGSLREASPRQAWHHGPSVAFRWPAVCLVRSGPRLYKPADESVAAHRRHSCQKPSRHVRHVSR